LYSLVSRLPRVVTASLWPNSRSASRDRRDSSTARTNAGWARGRLWNPGGCVRGSRRQRASRHGLARQRAETWEFGTLESQRM